MCPCPGGHYIYKPKKMKGKKGIDKKRKKIRKKVKKIGKDGKEYEEWDWVVPSDSDLVSRLSVRLPPPLGRNHFSILFLTYRKRAFVHQQNIS